MSDVPPLLSEEDEFGLLLKKLTAETVSPEDVDNYFYEQARAVAKGRGPRRDAGERLQEFEQIFPGIREKGIDPITEYRRYEVLFETADRYVKPGYIARKGELKTIHPEDHKRFLDAVNEMASGQAIPKLKFETKAGRAVARGVESMWHNFKAFNALVDHPDPESAPRQELDLVSQAERIRQSYIEPEKSPLSRGLFNALELAPMVLSTVALSVAVGPAAAPVASTMLWHTQITADAYQELRAQGIDPSTARRAAIATGLVEAAEEQLAMWGVGLGPASSVGAFARKYLGELVKEVFIEEGAQAVTRTGFKALAVSQSPGGQPIDLRQEVRGWGKQLVDAAWTMPWIMAPGIGGGALRSFVAADGKYTNAVKDNLAEAAWLIEHPEAAAQTPEAARTVPAAFHWALQNPQQAAELASEKVLTRRLMGKVFPGLRWSANERAQFHTILKQTVKYDDAMNKVVSALTSPEVRDAIQEQSPAEIPVRPEAEVGPPLDPGVRGPEGLAAAPGAAIPGEAQRPVGVGEAPQVVQPAPTEAPVPPTQAPPSILEFAPEGVAEPRPEVPYMPAEIATWAEGQFGEQASARLRQMATEAQGNEAARLGEAARITELPPTEPAFAPIEQLTPEQQQREVQIIREMESPVLAETATERYGTKAPEMLRAQVEQARQHPELFTEDDVNKLSAAAEHAEAGQETTIPPAEAITYRPEVPLSLEPNVEAPVSSAGIYGLAKQLFNIPIESGRIREKAEAIFKVHPEVIRMKGTVYGDVPILAHEIAHPIVKRTGLLKRLPPAVRAELKSLDYDQDLRRETEGFAEFLLYWFTDNRVLADTPATSAWFDNYLAENQELAANLTRFKEAVQLWSGQGAEARVRAQLSRSGVEPRPTGQTFWEWVKVTAPDLWNVFYTRGKDSLHPIHVVQNKEQAPGYRPPGEVGAYDLALALTQNGPKFAHDAVKNGIWTLEAPGQEGRKLAPGLNDIFADIAPEEQDDFETYAVARHSLEMHDKGINPGWTRQDAEFTARKLHNPRFEQAAKGLTAWNNALLRVIVAADPGSAADIERMINFWETYLPMHRVRRGFLARRVAGQRIVNLGFPVKARKGSGRQIISPIQSTIERATRIYTYAAKKLVENRLVETAKTRPGLGEDIEQIPPEMQPTRLTFEDIRTQLAERGFDVFTDFPEMDPEMALAIYRPDLSMKAGQPYFVHRTPEGGRELYQVSRALNEAINTMNFFQMPWFLEMTSGMANRLLKLGATGLSPGFGVRNPIRDYVTYLFQREAGAALFDRNAPPMALASFVQSEIQKIRGKTGDPYVQLWEAMGGPLSQVLGLDRNQVRNAANDVFANTANRRILNLAKHPLDALRGFIGITEVGPRVAEFGAVMEAEGYSRQRLNEMLARGRRPPLEVLVKAINAANDVTTNFKRMGTWGRWLNANIPFFNAAIEGFDKMVRSGVKNPGRLAMRASMFAASTLGYWWYNKDRDWYQEAPPWLKYGFWTMTNAEGRPIIRIPRGFDYGWIISAGSEAIADAMYRKDPQIVMEWATEAIDQTIPDLIPAIIKPGAEAYFNYDMFRDRAIVNDRLKKLPPKYQAYPQTTKLAKQLGAMMNISPAKIEHLLNGYSGGLYKNLAFSLEDIAEGFEGAVLADVPAIGGLAIRTEPGYSITKFYNEADAVERRYNGADIEGEVPEKLDLERDKFREAIQDMAAIRRQYRETTGEKYDEGQRYIIALARRALGLEALERYPIPPDELL